MKRRNSMTDHSQPNRKPRKEISRKDVPYDQYMKDVNHSLTHGGIFLTTKGEKANSMVIGWGGIVYFWNAPVFLAPVRASHPVLDSTGFFTVSIPLGRDLRKEIAFCGSKSGRDYDKLKECGLTPVPGKTVPVPIIGECGLHYECKVVYKQTMDPALLDPEINEKWYPDYHTMFYGEILACYTTEV
jgi:flavin reductase (DIM6/NTAB) family NADH-FMN oxidoreductase RutF